MAIVRTLLIPVEGGILSFFFYIIKNDFDLLQITNCTHFYFKKVGSVLGSGSGRTIPDPGSIFDVSDCPGSIRAIFI
jgi:hypothetical protein